MKVVIADSFKVSGKHILDGKDHVPKYFCKEHEKFKKDCDVCLWVKNENKANKYIKP